MRIAGFVCALLLGLAACGCHGSKSSEETTTFNGVLRGPGPSSPGAPAKEWVVDKDGDEHRPVPVDISRMRDRALKLEGKSVKVTVWNLTPADVEAGRTASVVKDLEPR
jgi:hypothetical protein